MTDVRASPTSAWREYQDHKNLIDDKEPYAQLAKDLTQFWANDEREMVHFLPIADPQIALATPITEFALLKLRDRESKKQLEGIIAAFAAASVSEAHTHTATGFCWGPILERDDTFGIMIGWPSVEV